MSGPFGSSSTLFSSSDFEVQHGAHFNGEANYISRTPGSAGNRRTFTISCWFKPSGRYENSRIIFGAGNNSGSHDYLILGGGQEIKFSFATEASGDVYSSTNRKFRDPGAWYHLVAAVDTTQGTAANRVKLYINGVQQTTGGTQPDQNFDSSINNTVVNRWGTRSYDTNSAFDGYLAECHIVDGQQLTPASFGVEGTHKEWKPIQYTGVHGTNGVHLDFQDSGDLGADASGTGDWTATNFGVQDQVRDTPSNNFPTLNILSQHPTIVVDNGHRRLTSANGLDGTGGVLATQELPHSGKWYWEVHAKDIDNNRPNHYYGIEESRSMDHRTINTIGSGIIQQSRVYQSNGNGTKNESESAYGGAWSDGDIIAVQADMDNGKIYYRRNNTLESSGAAAFSIDPYYQSFVPSFGVYEDAANVADGGNRCIVNFGQDSSFLGTKTAQGNQDGNGNGDFYYTPPAGYLALCSKNLPEPDVVPQEHFNTVLHTGTGNNGNSISGVGFSPDLTIIRDRGTADSTLHDSVRGSARYLSTSTNEGAGNRSTRMQSFDSDGYTVGDGNGTSGAYINVSGNSYVGWSWYIPTAHSVSASGSGSNKVAAVTGAINVAAGQGIYTYEGDGEGKDIYWGLSNYTTYPEGVAIWIKRHDNNGNNWATFHTYGYNATDYMALNTNDATQDSSTFYNDTNPSNNFQIMSDARVGANGNEYVAYAFHDVEGYSRFGSYIGNGNSDGPFVPCGFQPAMVIVKKVNAAHNWVCVDNVRNPGNIAAVKFLNYDTDGAEDTDPCIDLVSGGFKVRDTAARYNTDGSQYIFHAWASLPAKYNNAR